MKSSKTGKRSILPARVPRKALAPGLAFLMLLQGCVSPVRQAANQGAIDARTAIIQARQAIAAQQATISRLDSAPPKN